MAKLNSKYSLTPNIKGFSKYHITSKGKVIRIDNHKEIKPTIHHHTKRSIVHLYDDYGKRYNLKVYRLVALAYIPNPENKPFVCHKDNNVNNNHCSNLYWGTAKENSEQMVKDGRSTKGRKNIRHKPFIPLKGFKCSTCKLSQENFKELENYIKNPSRDFKWALISKFGISRRSFDRYITHIKENYYE